MKIQRTIPPAAAPLSVKNVLYGLAGLVAPRLHLARLEAELRAYFGVKHVFLLSSGKAALALILAALRSLEPGKKKALIPAYTCYSVPSAVVKAGLDIALCDIDEKTFGFDNALLERSVDEDTLCVVTHHLFGIPSDVDGVRNACRKKGAFVVEDAAQAMGCTSPGGLLGTRGDVGFFSVGRGKNITCGSGGIIVTNDERIGEAVQKLYRSLEQPRLQETLGEIVKALVLSIFIHPFLYWFPAGLSFLRLGETIFYRDFPIRRLPGAQAAMLRHWQQRLAACNEGRQKNGAYFLQNLGLRSAGGDGGPVAYLRLPFLANTGQERDGIVSQEHNWRMGISRMYPAPVSDIEEIRDQFRGRAFPAARMTAERLFTVPTHTLLTRRDRERICRLLESVTASGEGVFQKRVPQPSPALTTGGIS